MTTSDIAIVGEGCLANLTSSSNDSTLKRQLGAGLGLGLGIPLLISLALLYWEHRRRIKVEGQLVGIGGTAVGMVGDYYQAPSTYAKFSSVSNIPTELQAEQPAQELPIDHR